MEEDAAPHAPNLMKMQENYGKKLPLGYWEGGLWFPKKLTYMPAHGKDVLEELSVEGRDVFGTSQEPGPWDPVKNQPLQEHSQGSSGSAETRTFPGLQGAEDQDYPSEVSIRGSSLEDEASQESLGSTLSIDNFRQHHEERLAEVESSQEGDSILSVSEVRRLEGPASYVPPLVPETSEARAERLRAEADKRLERVLETFERAQEAMEPDQSMLGKQSRAMKASSLASAPKKNALERARLASLATLSRRKEGHIPFARNQGLDEPSKVLLEAPVDDNTKHEILKTWVERTLPKNQRCKTFAAPLQNFRRKISTKVFKKPMSKVIKKPSAKK